MSRAASIHIQRRIEWSDTDASGHWHNTAALRLIEWAERALLDRLGLVEEIYGELPRVRYEVDYRRPLYFNELADIFLEVVDVRRTSVTYQAKIASDGKLCVEARLIAVLRDGEGRTRTWPEDYRRRLLTAGPQPPELVGP